MKACRGRIDTLQINHCNIAQVFFFLVDTSVVHNKMEESDACVISLALKIFAFGPLAAVWVVD